MPMVKAYHGKQCAGLQLCCSNWTEPNTPQKNDLLRKDVEMEERNWLWDSNAMKSSLASRKKGLKYLPLDPPFGFQDNLTASPFIEKFADSFTSKLVSDVLLVSSKITWSIPCSQDCHMSDSLPIDGSALWNGLRLCWTPELLPAPKSRKTLSGCVSASHNSLSTGGGTNVDEAPCMRSALSQDALTSKQMSDMYNVPFDSDLYSVPADMLRNRFAKPSTGSDASNLQCKCYHPSSAAPSDGLVLSLRKGNSSQKERKVSHETDKDVTGRRCNDSLRKSHTLDSCSTSTEPIHVTVEEVRRYLQTLYARTEGENPEERRHLQDAIKRLKKPFKSLPASNNINEDVNLANGLKVRSKYIIPARSKKAKENGNTAPREYAKMNTNERFKKGSACRPSFSTNIKETLCNIFRIKKLASSENCLWKRDMESRSDEIGLRLSGYEDQNPPSPITKPPFSKRALPPVPPPSKLEDNHRKLEFEDNSTTTRTPPPSPEESPPSPLPSPPTHSPTEKQHPSAFATSIEKVKDYGWYWGPISGQEAERILLHEPDGSFIVRDSSDDYYIFSLTFKLNSLIRHVRIEHDQGNFSFGSPRFKRNTIVDFIESAVEHSRSGRYLFFLHRRPVLGPMRVQLLHPVSRFRKVHTLQHLCRFVVLKMVRRDLIQTLPLPKTLLDYLSNRHYYMEHLMYDDSSDSSSREDLDQLLPMLRHDIGGG